jgi:hypothetical protein
MNAMLKEPFLNYAEIARNLHLSVGSVSKHARRLGLPSRSGRALKHYEEIQKLVGEKGQAGAAKKLGVFRQCVHGCLERLARVRGGEARRRSRAGKERTPQRGFPGCKRSVLECASAEGRLSEIRYDSCLQESSGSVCWL